eukprot:CAMPEP_0168530786 /NCGR_PEP_ID=MMETSP0405-20121227/14933_1 /TAXON_ID=498012 /ORGANISM="Trichosphaerium sp, Strain Am-I-7 wt" /LENGTH=456 /DNA_ID=CAMNT_0008555211 /DNA_START=269 /DNA_END=1635 /DNA_ORIENTATION=+
MYERIARNQTTLWALSAHLDLSANIATWLKLYQLNYFPCYGIPTRQWDAQNIISTFKTATTWGVDPNLLEITAILAFGARCAGSNEPATHFNSLCKRMQANLGTLRHPYVAGGLILLGDYGLIMGDMESSYTTICQGVDMMKTLKQEMQNHQKCLDYLVTLCNTCRVFTPRIRMNRSEVLQEVTVHPDLPKMDVTEFVDVKNSETLKERQMQVLWCIIGKLWLSVSRPAVINGKPCFHLFIQKHSGDDYYQFLKNTATLNMSSVSFSQSVKRGWLVAADLFTTFSCFSKNAVNIDRALQHAKSAFKKFIEAEHNEDDCPGAICSMYDMCLIAIRSKDTALFHESFSHFYEHYVTENGRGKFYLRSLAFFADTAGMVYDKSLIQGFIDKCPDMPALKSLPEQANPEIHTMQGGEELDQFNPLTPFSLPEDAKDEMAWLASPNHLTSELSDDLFAVDV